MKSLNSQKSIPNNDSQHCQPSRSILAQHISFTQPAFNSDKHEQTKIEYLSQQVQQLTEEKKELDNLIKINKDIIKLNQAEIQQLQSSENYSKNIMSVRNNKAGTVDLYQQLSEQQSDQIRANKVLVEKVLKENEHLYKIINRLIQQRDHAQSKILINEQIAISIQDQEKEILHDAANKIQYLQIDIQKKNEQIEQLLNDSKNSANKQDQSQQKPALQTQTAAATREIEIIKPNDQTLKLQEKLEKVYNFLDQVNKANSQLQQDKNELIALNSALKLELDNAMLGINQHNQETIIQDQYLQVDPNLKQQLYQKSEEIALNNNIENLDEQMHSSIFEENLPQKVQMVNFCNQSQNTNGLVIPKLNLAKAQYIQEINLKQQQAIQQKEQIKALYKQAGQLVNPIVQEDNKNNTANIDSNNINGTNNSNNQQKWQIVFQQIDKQNKEKISKLEEELNKSKKLLENEMIRNKILEDESYALKQHVQKLESQNDILINSNIIYENKWMAIYHSYIFYRDFYIHNNQAYLAKKIKNNSIFISPGDQYISKVCDEFDVNDPYYSPESLARFIGKNEKKKGNQIIHLNQINDNQMQILTSRQHNDPEQIIYNNTNEDQIIELAKDLYSNPQIKKSNIFFWNQSCVHNKQQQFRTKKKRSNSMDKINKKEKLVIQPLKMLKKEINQIRTFTTQTMKQLQTNQNKIYNNLVKKQIMQSFTSNTNSYNNNNNIIYNQNMLSQEQEQSFGGHQKITTEQDFSMLDLIHKTQKSFNNININHNLIKPGKDQISNDSFVGDTGNNLNSQN